MHIRSTTNGRMRKISCDRLLRYIRKKDISPDVLEVGCGNGWLTAKIAGVTGGKVTGLDTNHLEIEQAKRVFGHMNNCRFITGDIFLWCIERREIRPGSIRGIDTIFQGV